MLSSKRDAPRMPATRKLAQLQIGCCGLFPLCNLYLVGFLSLRGLLPLRALIDDNHSNLLVVFRGLTLLGRRVIAIGHLSQKHPS